MISLLARKFNTARRIGLVRSAHIGIDRLYLTFLAWIFKFHPWHAEAPTSVRPYRYLVAKLVNKLEPTTVVEVGCGLGFILELVRAPRRYGFDLDEGAVRAAQFLHDKSIIFTHGDLTSVDIAQIDVMILVNWIHDVSPSELDALLKPLLRRTRFLLLDAIDPDESSGYRYKHDFAFLASKTRRLSIAYPENEGRSLQLFEVLA
jgi:SAM-dependent methyltransferase